MEISISKETERFADFLKQKDNENIIFSGAFGIGKSYFLNNFFNQHKDSQTRSHTDNFGENNVKCLIAKGICRFVPHSSAGGF